MRRAAPIPLIAVLIGCGSSAASRTPRLTDLPLVDGTRVVAQARVCDRGANAFCAVEVVLVGSGFASSQQLVDGERDQLRHGGWTGANPDTGDERANDSPGHRFRVTYATALGELKDIDLGWVQRARPIALALSRSIFDRSPAMAVLLEVGTS
jgi:hypothetical protein